MAQSSPITILFLAANPSGTAQLDLNKEYNAIEDEIDTCKFRDRFNLEQRFELKSSNISKQLLKHNPHIVHFSGHGSKEGKIILQDSIGKAHPVDAEAITNLFSILNDNIKCVVLNACYTKIQAMLISRHIECVIGMSKAIGDEAAIKFAQGFYRGLGYGKDLETAFKLGCAQINLQGLKEEDTPKIIWKNDEPKKIVLVENIISPQKLKQLPSLPAKCDDIITALNNFIEDPSLTNDKKAWKGFKEFILLAEQASSECEIEDNYDELIEIRNTIARLRISRNCSKKAGLYQDASKTEAVIQSNYVDSIKVIKEIQEKLPKLGR